MADLFTHIDGYLGRIDAGWSFRDEAGGVQIVKVSNCPVVGVIAYSTLGMSWTELKMPRGRRVRQELVFAAYERYPSSKVASFLLTFCRHTLSTGSALLRGDAVQPYRPFPGVAAESVYCTIPMLFDPRLKTFTDSEPPTVFVWLVPTTRAETEYVRTNGWNKFEDHLEIDQPDFWNLDRESLILS